jgi:riboflavin kinase / FMN adenylyltransferase
MQFFGSLAEVPKNFGPSAVAIGKFDGMHSGHQRLLSELRLESDRAGLVSVAVTFDRHPLSLLKPDSCPDPLISNAQKVELLEAAGIDATIMLTFDREFSELAPRAFVEDILVTALRTKSVLVGADFRFGAKGQGSVESLMEFGAEFDFSVRRIDDVVPEEVVAQGRRASSTWIRELLSQGKVTDAAKLLGRLPSVRATVVRGEQRGRTLGYPTANLGHDLEGFAPADGVYAAWIWIDGKRFGSAVSVGNNPTFAGVRGRQIEAYVLDESLDLYGKSVEIEFVDYIRPMNKFEDAAALVAQMNTDEQVIRSILRERAPSDG